MGFLLTARRPPLQARVALAVSCPGRDCGEADAQEADPDARLDVVAVRRAAADSVDVPTAAPDHPVRAAALEEVRAPLKDVTMHVVDSESVRFVRAHFRGAFQILPLGRIAGGRSPEQHPIGAFDAAPDSPLFAEEVGGEPVEEGEGARALLGREMSTSSSQPAGSGPHSQHRRPPPSVRYPEVDPAVIDRRQGPTRLPCHLARRLRPQQFVFCRW